MSDEKMMEQLITAELHLDWTIHQWRSLEKSRKAFAKSLAELAIKQSKIASKRLEQKNLSYLTALAYHQIDRMSYKQIAEKFNIAIGTAGSWVRQGQLQIKKMGGLKPWGQPGEIENRERNKTLYHFLQLVIPFHPKNKNKIS
jgi:hypothetical protein